MQPVKPAAAVVTAKQNELSSIDRQQKQATL